MSTLIENGYPIFTDKNGDPLEEGYIFIGEAGLNPISNPQTAYWDAGLTIPARNIRTQGGYPVYQGSPSRLYVEDGYSIYIQDKQMNTVYVLLDATSFAGSSDFTNTGFDFSELESSGASTVILKDGSTADVSGEVAEIIGDVFLNIPLNDTDYYVHLTGSGSGTVPSLETDTGTYDVALNALYDGPKRVLNWKVRSDGSSVRIAKIVDMVNIYSIDQNVTKESPLDLDTAHIVDANITNLHISENYLHNNSILQSVLYTFLDPFIPDVGDTVLLTGGFNATSATNTLHTALRAERTSSSVITIYGLAGAGIQGYTFGASGGSTWDVSIGIISTYEA